MKKLTALFTMILLAGFLFALPSKSSVAPNLSDRNATENAKQVYKFLRDNYGKKVLTGMMENAWDNNFNELEKVQMETGKYPALMGYDFMNYTGLGWSAKNVQIERAIMFWNGYNYEMDPLNDYQGLVSFMWHWRDPLTPSGKTGEFYSDKTKFRIPYDTDTKTWKTSSKEYKAIIRDLDTIAEQLLLLQENDVAVLWRPLHEAAGNVGLYGKTGTAWFWWGNGNSTDRSVMTNQEICGECYVALWKLMYKYFTITKGIHNLIWVWNGENEYFYPGSEYVDIIGTDIYNNPKNYSSGISKFNKMQAIDPTKMVALTECGVIPSMEAIEKDGAWWSFFMVWNDNKNERTTAKDQFWYGDFYNPKDYKKKIYSSKIAVTLDELPNIMKY